MSESAKVDRVGQKANSLAIVAAGLCCSLGYRLDAAVSAIRANMDHFQESSFYSSAGVIVNAATLPDDVVGYARLQRWAEFAVRDCASQLSNPACLLDAERTAVIMLAPDEDRPHANKKKYEELAHAVLKQLANELDYESDSSPHVKKHRVVVIAEGRTGIAEGLLKSAGLFVGGEADHVLLIGVDSYLNAADINFYLEEERLMIKGNSNGFIPGEAAAALLLRSVQSTTSGIHIKGVGVGVEPGRCDGSVPSRGQGLSEALRAACTQAKVDPIDLDFRVSDQNGERFYSNDAANAVTRVMLGGPKLTELTLADKIGEVGCASGPSMLAWLYRDMNNATHSPGKIGIAHLSNDNGARCAVVIRKF